MLPKPSRRTRLLALPDMVTGLVVDSAGGEAWSQEVRHDKLVVRPRRPTGTHAAPQPLEQDHRRRLRRSRPILGVDAVLIRIAAAAVALASGVGVVA